MKKYFKKIILVLGVLLVPISSSAMPVVDASQITESVLTLARWGEQIQEWKDEYDNWEKEYNSIKDARLDGSLLDKISEVNNILRDNNLDFASLNLENPVSQIGIYAKALLASYNLFDDCTDMGADQTRICKSSMIRSLQEISAIKTISENANELIEKLNELTTQLKNAIDDKETQDITAGLQSTMTSLNALKMQYEMLELRNKASERIDLRQKEQLRMQRFQNSEAFYNNNVL